MSLNKIDIKLRDYDRELLKRSLVSLFWAVISDRKTQRKYTMQDVANAVGRDKSAVSRWFSTAPNWRLETIADIASALELDMELRARDRTTGIVYTPSGPAAHHATTEVRSPATGEVTPHVNDAGHPEASSTEGNPFNVVVA